MKGAIILVAFFFGGLVQPRLTDDCVNRDRRFPGRPVANDQFALAAADWNHRVDRHDSGLDRLAYAAPLDNARGDFFLRIEFFVLYDVFVVEMQSVCRSLTTQ